MYLRILDLKLILLCGNIDCVTLTRFGVKQRLRVGMSIIDQMVLLLGVVIRRMSRSNLLYYFCCHTLGVNRSHTIEIPPPLSHWWLKNDRFATEMCNSHIICCHRISA